MELGSTPLASKISTHYNLAAPAGPNLSAAASLPQFYDSFKYFKQDSKSDFSDSRSKM